MNHKDKMKIVITGGPGGGKTTALDLFQREYLMKVKIVPEAATLLYQHGLNKESQVERRVLLQESIYKMQITLESIYRRLYPDRLLVCDRGTLDGLAYWPLDENNFFQFVQSTSEIEVNRYGAVIFFETGATHGKDIGSNNPYRDESSRVAIELDRRLKEVWQRHPNFHYIPSDTSFMRKIAHGILTINSVMDKLGL